MTDPPAVLVVDDDPEALASLAALLAGEGYAVATAADGEAALGLLRAGPAPAVLVADYQLPGLDGLALLRRAAACAPATVGVLITGQREVYVARDRAGEAYGPAYYLLFKPADPHEVLETVERAARLARGSAA